MKKSVYVETTIVSYLTARPSNNVIYAARRAITRRWWKDRRGDFNLFTSQAVLQEAEKGNKAAAKRRIQVLEHLTYLDSTDESLELAAALIAKGAMPSKASVDALHFAVAAVKKIDFLLTWNYRHLANAEMMNAVAKVTAAMGHRVPIVCTPEELMGG